MELSNERIQYEKLLLAHGHIGQYQSLVEYAIDALDGKVPIQNDKVVGYLRGVMDDIINEQQY